MGNVGADDQALLAPRGRIHVGAVNCGYAMIVTPML
jgi:hypothetical protein